MNKTFLHHLILYYPITPDTLLLLLDNDIDSESIHEDAYLCTGNGIVYDMCMCKH